MVLIVVTPTKDLFFSGHASSMVYFFLLARPVWLKRTLLILVVFAIIAILWQRVHYSIDVFVGIVGCSICSIKKH